MRVPVAMLADYALAHPDNKLYVTGGGITSLSFDQFPATYPRLALALGIEVARDEFDRQHALRIVTSGPSTPPFRTVAFAFSRPSSGSEGAFDFVSFVSSMDEVVFHAAGTYSFDVSIDDEKLASVRLIVSKRAAAPVLTDAGPAAEANSLVEAGYAAFASRDVSAAEDLFRRAIDLVPTWAPPHNNLGFTLLLQGSADEAMREFAEATRLGYPQDEITDANVACAMYVSKDFEAAEAKFVECLRSRVLRGAALLYGIDGSSLFLEHVGSAAAYTGLVSLNAAWSATRSGHDAAANQYRTVAEAAHGTLALSRRFAESLENLGKKPDPKRNRATRRERSSRPPKAS